MTATRVMWDGGWARHDVTTALMLLVLGSAGVSGCDRTSSGSGDLEGDIRLAASDVRVYGTSDLIAGIEDLEVTSDGRVWLLNSLEPLFIGFGPDESAVQAYGRMGGGPEEFRRPSGFVAGGVDGQVWVLDRGHHALLEVAGPEAGRLALPLPQDAIPPGSVTPGMRIGWSDLVRTGRLDEEVILPRRADTPEPGIQAIWLSAWTADLVGVNPRTGSVRTIVKLGETLGDPRPHFDLEGAFLPFPLWFRLWAVCSESEIYLYDRLQNEVRRFARDGDELTAIPLPPVRRASMSTEEFAQALFFAAAIEAAPAVPPGGQLEMSPADSARIMEGLRARLTAPPDRLAELLPRYLDLRCDEDGTLWLQRFDIDAGGLEGGPTWIRVTLDGSRSEIRFPDGFDPSRFTSERIWGVHRGELGVASVAWVPTQETP